MFKSAGVFVHTVKSISQQSQINCVGGRIYFSKFVYNKFKVSKICLIRILSSLHLCILSISTPFSIWSRQNEILRH